MLGKRKKFLILIGGIFLSLIGLMTVSTRTFAEKNEEILIEESFLTVSYSTELADKENIFHIKLSREGKNEQQQNRLKLKLLTEKEKIIDYPAVDGMEEKDGWLIEQEFTHSGERELKIAVPKKYEKLQMYVELNEQTTKKSQNEQDTTESDTDILGINEPLWLKVEKKATKKDSKNSVTDNGENSFSLYSDQKIFSKPAEVPSVANARSVVHSNSYTNKEPIYKTDNGKYPEFSWQPIGQTNVINHQGGKDNTAANVWDGLQSWDTFTDNYKNSYIYYGVGAKEKGDIALRKYATETDKPDEFNIKLNVRGDSLTKPGVDVMFVLDNSASMTYTDTQYKIGGRLRKDVSIDSLSHLITQFKNNVPDNVGYLRLGGVVFGSDVISTSNLSSRYSDWDQLVTKYRNASTQSQQTYTQGGLIEAQKRLLADNNGRRKVLFLLTDGAPNRSRDPLAGKSDTTIFPSKVRITQYKPLTTGQTDGNAGVTFNSNGSTSLYVLNSGWNPVDNRFRITNIENPNAPLLIESHLDMANSQAADLRDKGIEIQAIAMGAYGGPGEFHSSEVLVKGLYKMTTQRANTTGNSERDYYFYQAQNLSDFEKSFQEWFESTLTTVERGVIEDPLGDMVELVGTPVVSDISLRNGLGTKAIKSERMAVVDSSNPRKIRVTNINLYGNQEIEITYKVRLKTEESSFASGRWYPANGKTILHSSPDRTEDKLDFGVPSVRAFNEDFVIPVKKIWSDDENNRWQKRQEVIAVLQKKDGNRWIDLHEVDLNTENHWVNRFPAVSGNPTIEYRVIEKIGNLNRVPGYAKPVYSQESFTSSNLDSIGITITNRLLTTDYSFKKVMKNGQPFTDSNEKRPKFTLTETIKNMVVVRDVAPDNGGVVNFTDLPAGIYHVSETFVPEGFKKCDDFIFTVTERTDGTAVIADSSNKTVTNELNKFKLTVVKTDEQGNEIVGAAFRLRNSSGTYNKTLTSGSTFVFTDIDSGVYYLKELTAPNSYIGLDGEITIDIFDNGLVSFDDNPWVANTVELGKDENQVTIKVKNRSRTGTLPRTGSFANRSFILLSAMCFMTGVGLVVVYLYIHRRRG
ncbi:VWA domain-containing protein [Enterococcus raffinosus]|uniref:SpaA isopeptide-forming pilin-related protein n=1 Tax=Enterococcus raffinosus TaxID=71452 RepID=UPI001C11F62F|nr:SpaA isopeptide-forming pilin-related protein [Enterococcus raffinosus]MBU5362077.1 VWA domain-containing protein [Enterococcus raffinosus]